MDKLYSGTKDRVYGVTFGPVASCQLKFVPFPVFVKRTCFSNLLCVGVPKKKMEEKTNQNRIVLGRKTSKGKNRMVTKTYGSENPQDQLGFSLFK